MRHAMASHPSWVPPHAAKATWMAEYFNFVTRCKNLFLPPNMSQTRPLACKKCFQHISTYFNSCIKALKHSQPGASGASRSPWSSRGWTNRRAFISWFELNTTGDLVGWCWMGNPRKHAHHYSSKCDTEHQHQQTQTKAKSIIKVYKSNSNN